MVNKYKNKDWEFLMFGEDLPKADESTELVEENAKIEENLKLPIFEQFGFQNDRKLFNEGIMSFEDLKNAYFLIKTKELNKSRYIRELVLRKYNLLSEYFSE